MSRTGPPRSIATAHLLSAFVLCALLSLASATSAYAQFAAPRHVVTLKAALSLDRLPAGSKFKVAVSVKVKPGYHIGSAGRDAAYPTKLEISGGPGISFKAPVFPPPKKRKFAYLDGKELAVYEGEFRIIVPGEVGRRAKPGPRTILAKLQYQACDETTCYPPAEDKVSVATRITPAGKATTINPGLFCGTTPPATPPSGGGMTDRLLAALAGASPIFAALISFALGLALCLSPCVYPMIPITVGFFAGQAEGRRARLFTLAVIYVLGMAVTYSALGVLAASFGMVVGAALQNPTVIAIIVAVFIALAMSMFGLFELQPPAFIMNRTGAKSGLAGAFLMGLMLGVVASPCVGPAVAGVAVWVTQLRNPVLGFWIFFSLSLGLGLPFLVLGVFSGAINRLPQAGAWMLSIKKLSGLALLGAAAYFGRLLLPAPLQRFVMPFFLLGVAVYLTSFKSSLVFETSRLARPALGVAVGVLGLLFLIPAPHRSSISWEAYTPQALERAAKGGKPVMIDFTADWCVVCRELESKTFTDPKVIEASCRFLRLRADFSRTSSEKEALLKRFDVKGFPTVIFLDSTGQELRDNRVVGFVEAEEFLRRMNEALGS